jgi:Subtilisin-like serine proteases
VEAAWKAGIVVVTAAGNFGRDDSMGTRGYGTIASPGNDPYAITVGAMNAKGTAWTSDDTIASYSSKGPTLVDHIVKPDLVAPGNQVISLMAPNSTLASNYPKLLISDTTYATGISGKSSNYLRLSGTSMATPVVSGAAALLLQQNPALTPDQVKARLMKTATKTLNLYSVGVDAYSLQSFSAQSDIFTVGAGYLNIAAALTNHDLVTLPALSPAAIRNPLTRKVTIERNMATCWGSASIWGDAQVFGNIVFSIAGITAMDDSVLWGDSVIWGLDDSVLWGDSALAASSMQALASDDDDQ